MVTTDTDTIRDRFTIELPYLAADIRDTRYAREILCHARNERVLKRRTLIDALSTDCGVGNCNYASVYLSLGMYMQVRTTENLSAPRVKKIMSFRIAKLDHEILLIEEMLNTL